LQCTVIRLKTLQAISQHVTHIPIYDDDGKINTQGYESERRGNPRLSGTYSG
jgi:hypothetical protein